MKIYASQDEGGDVYVTLKRPALHEPVEAEDIVFFVGVDQDVREQTEEWLNRTLETSIKSEQILRYKGWNFMIVWETVDDVPESWVKNFLGPDPMLSVDLSYLAK